ncbi:MAG: imidazole glycerol phosphate synthase subunit HisH [Bifidobacteriaceae bacterium]|jgi:glutamine amidotransferase|nr:imidazole glycerol phosphate synthase subunit HisH [Bifidobacteriaceae bacterium]
MRVVVLDYGFGNVRSAVRALRRVGAEVELTADPVAALEADGLVVPGVGAFAAVMEGLRSVRGPQLIDRRLAGGRGVLGICVGLQVMFERGDEHGVTSPGLGQWPGAVTRLKAAVVPHMGWSQVSPPPGSGLFRGVEQERFYFVHSYAAQEFPLGGEARPGPTDQASASAHDAVSGLPLPSGGSGRGTGSARDAADGLALPSGGSGRGAGLAHGAAGSPLPADADGRGVAPSGGDGIGQRLGPFAPPLVTWADHGGPFVAAVENGPLCATQFHPEKSGDAGAHLLENWIRTL